MTTMNNYIPGEWDDRVHFFAQRVEYDKTNDRWSLFVEPTNCLVALFGDKANMPSLFEVRNDKPACAKTPTGERCEGRILFSAGVLLFSSSQVLLIQRSKDAKVDPEKWMAPAGRCDRDPLTTAQKEFYEEIGILQVETDTPVFTEFVVDKPENASVDWRQLYSETLGRSLPRSVRPAAAWTVITAVTASMGPLSGQVVETQFGTERFSARLLVYFDRSANTVEMLLPARLDLDPKELQRFVFFDAERQQSVRLFSAHELAEIPETQLVPTIRHFKPLISSMIE